MWAFQEKKSVGVLNRRLTTCQIQRLLERSIFELSSGEKQSIAIASVYALAPKILVLDEPSANLDAAATEHLMEILHTLKQQGIPLLYLSTASII